MDNRWATTKHQPQTIWTIKMSTSDYKCNHCGLTNMIGVTCGCFNERKGIRLREDNQITAIAQGLIRLQKDFEQHRYVAMSELNDLRMKVVDLIEEVNEQK